MRNSPKISKLERHSITPISHGSLFQDISRLVYNPRENILIQSSTGVFFAATSACPETSWRWHLHVHRQRVVHIQYWRDRCLVGDPPGQRMAMAGQISHFLRGGIGKPRTLYGKVEKNHEQRFEWIWMEEMVSSVWEQCSRNGQKWSQYIPIHGNSVAGEACGFKPQMIWGTFLGGQTRSGCRSHWELRGIQVFNKRWWRGTGGAHKND